MRQPFRGGADDCHVGFVARRDGDDDVVAPVAAPKQIGQAGQPDLGRITRLWLTVRRRGPGEVDDERAVRIRVPAHAPGQCLGGGHAE